MERGGQGNDLASPDQELIQQLQTAPCLFSTVSHMEKSSHFTLSIPSLHHVRFRSGALNNGFLFSTLAVLARDHARHAQVWPVGPVGRPVGGWFVAVDPFSSGDGRIPRQVHLFLYDTAGQERFADMAASYYRVGEAPDWVPKRRGCRGRDPSARGMGGK